MKMKSWLELLVDANPILAIYGEDVPTLDSIDLHEIVLHRDGPRALLRFDLQHFPKCPPKKWVAAKFNRVQLKLLAVGIHQLSISGLQPKCVLNLSVTDSNGLICLHADKGEMKFDIVADNLLIDSVSAYHDGSL